jgi:hypothetical protein
MEGGRRRVARLGEARWRVAWKEEEEQGRPEGKEGR